MPGILERIGEIEATTQTRGAPPERCERCGFDSTRWSRQDAIRTVELADRFAVLAVESLPRSMWDERTDPSSWSIGDHVAHLADLMGAHRRAAETAVDSPLANRRDPSGMPTAEASPGRDPASSLESLDREATRLGAHLRSLEESAWRHQVDVGNTVLPLDGAVRHVCHELRHQSAEIARIRHRLGDVVGPLTGEVASVHASDGGVPKPAVPFGAIDAGGVAGDRQGARKHHGRPWQALCLWSADVVAAWAAEGHPIFPGAAGENLSVSGVDWPRLRSGLIVEIGTMTARLTAPAVPCAKNSRWFADGDQGRLGHDVSPGRARWYASVLTPGRVHPRDRVVVRSADRA
ncbi:MAG: MOSC domain-containing protein [Microthrixaceae bacterium]